MKKDDDRQTVYVLVGPKGAGKSFLGRKMESLAGVRFVDVEAIFLELPKERRSSYEGYEKVEAAVRSVGNRPCSLEVTGASPYTNRLLQHLRKERNVRLVRVEAPLETCLQRVEERPGQHLPAAPEMVTRIHEIVSELDLEWSVVVDGCEPDVEVTVRTIMEA